jgi:hypothetical protein
MQMLRHGARQARAAWGVAGAQCKLGVSPSARHGALGVGWADVAVVAARSASSLTGTAATVVPSPVLPCTVPVGSEAESTQGTQGTESTDHHPSSTVPPLALVTAGPDGEAAVRGVFDESTVAEALLKGWGDDVPLLRDKGNMYVRAWYGLPVQRELLGLLCKKAQALHSGGNHHYTGNGSCIILGEKGMGKSVTLLAFHFYVNDRTLASAASGDMVFAIHLPGHQTSFPVTKLREELLELSKTVNPALHKALLTTLPTTQHDTVERFRCVERALRAGRARAIVIADELNAVFTGHMDNSEWGSRSRMEWHGLLSGAGNAAEHTVTLIGAGSASSLMAMVTGGENYPGLNRFPLVGRDYNSQKLVPARLCAPPPFDLDVVRRIASACLTDTQLAAGVRFAGLASTEELFRMVAVASAANPRLTTRMLNVFCEGTATESTLRDWERREYTEFPTDYDETPCVTSMLHRAMYLKNQGLWDAARIDPGVDSATVMAKKLAQYVDDQGRDWTQLLQPLTMKEAEDVWVDMYRYGGIKLPPYPAKGIQELDHNYFVRTIGDRVYPISAMAVLLDHARPCGYIEDPALRRYALPGDTKAMVEARKWDEERKVLDIEWAVETAMKRVQDRANRAWLYFTWICLVAMYCLTLATIRNMYLQRAAKEEVKAESEEQTEASPSDR